MRYDDDVELNHHQIMYHHHQVEVKSMTDSQKNIHEKTPTEIFLTKPLPPSRVKITESCDQVRSDVTGYRDGKEWRRKTRRKPPGSHLMEASIPLSSLLPLCWILFLCSAIKGCISETLFSLDEHFFIITIIFTIIIKSIQAEVSWSPPEGEGHANLAGYQIKLRSDIHHHSNHHNRHHHHHQYSNCIIQFTNILT